MSAANAPPDTIVLIHGLWLTARSWEAWVERYQSVGYRVLAPNWPGMEAEVEAVNADPTPIASLTVEQIADRYESIVLELDLPPIIIGHSLGGTFTQILLDRGLGAAGVGVASVTVRRARDIPLTGGTALGHPRRPVHHEVLEQARLVRPGRRNGERDARVAAKVPQLALIRQRRQDDLVPIDPDPRGCDLWPPVLVDRDHVRDGVAFKELSSRLGERDPCHPAQATPFEQEQATAWG